MHSPFFLSNSFRLLVVAGNLGFSVWLVLLTGRYFDRQDLALSIVKRALAFSYAGGSLLTLLVAATYFFELEFTPEAARPWNLAREWSKIKHGMPEDEVIRLLGPPKEIRFETLYCYKIHPLTETLGHVEIKDGVVAEIKPEGEAASWIPPGWEIYLPSHRFQQR